MSDQGMSFLPDDYVERRVEQRTNLICLTLFVVVLAGVVGAWAVTSRHRSEVREQRAEVNEAYAEAAKRIEQLEKLRRQKQQVLMKAKTTATLLEPVPRTFLLADLVNRMPSTLSLLDLELGSKVIRPRIRVDKSRSALRNKKGKKGKDKEPTAPPVPEVVVTLKLIGVAPTDVQVAQYMAALAQSELLKDVNLVFSEETEVEGTPMRKFRVDMQLKPDADVRQIDPLRVPRKLDQDPMRVESGAVVPLESLRAGGEAAAPGLDGFSGPGLDGVKMED